MNLFKRFGAEIARLVLFAAVLGTVGASGQVYKWSQTVGTNANIDPHINFAEGQAPSSVNDSARAMMAELAKYRDDISGAITLGGISTAYTVATNQGLSATPLNGQMIAFIPNVTNGIAPTLQADGGNAFPIQSAAGTAISAGTIVQGTPYRASFNLSASAWVLEAGYGNPFAVPLGGILASTVDTAPNSNFVLAAGQCVSRTTFATYFSAVGTRFGACDGTTTFAVIDLKGRILAGLDNMNGPPANRMTNSSTGCGTAFTSVGVTCGNESTTLITANLPPYTPAGTIGNVVNSDNAAKSGGSNTFVPPGGLTAVLFNGLSSITVTSTFTGTAQGGTSTAFPRIQPTIGVNYFVRIL